MRKLLLGLTVLALAEPAQATTIRSRNTDQLFRDSDVVAVAQVVEVHAVQAGGSITTHATLSIAEGFKGPGSGASVEVLIPGGVVGRWGQHVEGAAQVTVGERCVVFLSRMHNDRYRFTGMQQGKLSIIPDPAHAGASLIRRTLTARFVEQAPDGTLRDAPPEPATEPLQPYLDHLRELAGGLR